MDNLTVQEGQENGETVDSYYYGDYLLGSVTVPEATPTPEPAADTVSENGSDAEVSGEEITQDNQNDVEKGQTLAEKIQLRKILLIIGAAMILLLIILCIALAKKERRYR